MKNDNSKFKIKLKRNLSNFFKELEIVCKGCGRKREEVTILYATKYLDCESFVSFLDIAGESRLSGGQVDTAPIIIGENRVQAAEQKLNFIKENYPDKLNLFYPVLIGNLQSNKVNKALNLFSEIHSVDRIELAAELDEKTKRNLPVFLEVNISAEESKHGFSIQEINDVLRRIQQLKNLTIKGLMTMAPHTDNHREIRSVFRKLRELADKYNLKTSMGMSHDWQIAVNEGADIIRIGSLIFS